MIDVRNEARFWGRQFIEHAQFTHDLIDAPSLKEVIAALLARGVNTNSPDAVAQFAQSLNAIHGDLFNRQSQGVYVGPMFPSLTQHMMLEQNWYLGIYSGVSPISQADYANFAAKNVKDAGTLTARLIDPLSAPASNQVQAIADSLTIPPQSISALDNAIHAMHVAGASPQFVAALKAISPVMVDHEDRENLHYLEKR
jgi:hypothetical protein